MVWINPRKPDSSHAVEFVINLNPDQATALGCTTMNVRELVRRILDFWEPLARGPILVAPDRAASPFMLPRRSNPNQNLRPPPIRPHFPQIATTLNLTDPPSSITPPNSSARRLVTESPLPSEFMITAPVGIWTLGASPWVRNGSIAPAYVRIFDRGGPSRPIPFSALIRPLFTASPFRALRAIFSVLACANQKVGERAIQCTVGPLDHLQGGR